jgi:mono/diheme cytochrome c family protein
MSMQRLVLTLAGLGMAAGLGFGAAMAQPAKKPADAKTAAPAGAAHGKQLWDKIGCYQCHGYQGQGTASAGPKLAPTPIPFEAFEHQLRTPRDRMPIYTAVVVPDGDLHDLYAYLQSIPKAKTVAEIPLLNQ